LARRACVAVVGKPQHRVKRDRPLPKQSDGQAPLEKLLKLDYSFLC
jgi:hypothetical protein